MNVVELTSVDAPELDLFRNLTDVALRSRAEPEAGIYLAESAKVIRRALSAGHEPIALIMEPKWFDGLRDECEPYPNVNVYLGTPDVLESLTGFHVHRGAIAAFKRPALQPIEELLTGARRLVILDGIVDHTNVGAAFRAVAGLGADAVFITENCADPLYRRSVRVSMGTVLQVPWTRMPSWHATQSVLHAHGFHIAAFALDERSRSLDAFVAESHEKLAIVLGSEGHGLGPEALAAADTLVSIPMAHGVDSLNVASACAVAVWALRPPALRTGSDDSNT